ncbi:ABC transporter permease [Conexibacter woesei]|uniref:Binding-protein-dependent transport systems inner membrane component n=1 Tax=Conexibacter woesei (strain DSM 14684 / CCUG 47730 / CIP 108061 / JCM 11494 / NBRC 100937 / ID131577) TaxID=469383 RepID=D3F4A6_CONWI|nr:ABC transporter permease [Conexibacter woesei]ADB50478.1 binding-protein-dependent transport systems inner membrane component [Conexibacter woesei DSM 14684]
MTTATASAALTSPVRWAGRHRRLAFLGRRLVRLAVSLILLLTASFAMLHAIPGDPVRAALGPSAPQSLVTARQHDLGLDQPLTRQYADYLGGALAGDLGRSISSQEPVGEIVAQRLPATLRLAGLAFLLIVLIAFPLGLLMAILTQHGAHRRAEVAFTAATGVLNTVPEFVVGTALVAAFAVGLGILPVAGDAGPASYVLPCVALALAPAATLSRVVRVETLKVLDEDFIRTARSKRLPASRIYLRHALPNAITASLTLGGLILSALIGGTVLVENVFAWPGLGSTVVQAVLSKDYPVVQACVLVLGGAVLLINTAVDFALALLDPRSDLRGA